MIAQQLARFVQQSFQELADPATAVPMAAYMKTSMPFYGIKKPFRLPVYREMRQRFKPGNQREYEAGVRSLWRLLHREEKYAAIAYARAFKDFIALRSILLYERLIREGAWWDLVDDVAINLSGQVLLTDRKQMRPIVEEWVDDEDLWIRRAALLSQIQHKDRTDTKQLFDHCLRRAHEKEFFIRKAIGWALRAYSYEDPEAVRDFLHEHRDRLSGLSFREGAKQLTRIGMMAGAPGC